MLVFVLQIFDGSSLEAYPFRVCEELDEPIELMSTSNVATIAFYSDGGIERRGFKLEFKLCKNGLCFTVLLVNMCYIYQIPDTFDVCLLLFYRRKHNSAKYGSRNYVAFTYCSHCLFFLL